MIEVSNLSKYYAGHCAIDRVSFAIDEGEIVGLLGLNGAGKSTILKILGCFLMPSSGQAKVAGHSVDGNPQAIRRLIGYLPDQAPLYNEMSVLGYLRYVARLKDVAASDVERKVAAAVAKTNLQDVSAVRLGELSHGYRQRVSIAQALVHEPRVLILDEPINGLDPVQIVEMRDLILSLRGQHTVILSSHILSEITKTCDRILIIDRGRLVAEGAEADIEQRVAKSMRLICDIERDEAMLLETLRAVPGVTTVVREANEDGGTRLVVDTSADVRAAVASVIVNTGVGLTGFSRQEVGLESIFLRLVNSERAARS